MPQQRADVGDHRDQELTLVVLEGKRGSAFSGGTQHPSHDPHGRPQQVSLPSLPGLRKHRLPSMGRWLHWWEKVQLWGNQKGDKMH